MRIGRFFRRKACDERRQAIPMPDVWRRVGFYTVAYYPDSGHRPFAIATLGNEGSWTLDFPGNAHLTELTEVAPNIRAAMSAAEEQWTEHSRSLRGVDTAIAEANRPL